MNNKLNSSTNKKAKINAKKNKKLEEEKDQDNKSIEDKNKKRKKPVKLIKCQFCQNPIPDPKKTLNFSCQHQLCGVCISRCIFRDYFKCITEKNNLITLYCNECKKNNVSEPGSAEVQISFIVSVLKDTYKTRNKTMRNICQQHDKLADYCADCKNWICEICEQEFHAKNFPSHSSFYPEEPFTFKACHKHMDRGLELYCEECKKDICAVCAFKGGEHSSHKILSMYEFKKKVIKTSKKFKYQNMEELDIFLEKLRIEFKKKYEDMYKQKSNLISEITTLLQSFYDKFFRNKEKMEKFIENYFKIIRACYFNYFKDIEEKEPRIDSLKFIECIDKEILKFDYDSKYTKELENIKKKLDEIQPQHFFDYKLRFDSHNFECIKTLRDKSIKDQIYCLTQLKNGNIITGGTKGILTEWDINTGLKIDSFKAHSGTIFSIIETTNNQIISSGSDSWINIWDLKGENNNEPKIVNLVKEKEPPKVEEIITVVNQQPKESNNEIKLNQIPNSQINEIPKVENNQTNIHANPPNLLGNNLYNRPINIKIPGNENIGQTNIQNLNQPQINLYQNAPDGGYGGNGNFNEYPHNLGYGSSGVSQNNNTNNQNNININTNINNNININNNLNQGIGVNEATNQNQNNINSTGLLANQSNNNNIINNENTINNNNTNAINNTNNNLEPNTNININNNTNNFMNNNTTTNININNTNINTNPFLNNNTTVNQNPQNKQEEEEKKYDEPFDDFEEGDINKANPPKKPSSSEKKILESIKYNCIMKLHGHEDEVNCILETQDKTIISCSKDNFILLWSTNEPESPKKINAHKNGVGCGLEFKKNMLITGGGEGLIKIWNLDQDDPLETVESIKAHKNSIFSICKISEDKIGSASCDKSIKIWDLNDKECTQVFDGHGGYIWSLIKVEMIDKDEEYKDIKKNFLVSCSSDKTIRFWDLDEARCYKTIHGHEREITTLKKLNDGNIVSGSLDSNIKIWKLKN